jgi:N-carbamoylputrescine amidase
VTTIQEMSMRVRVCELDGDRPDLEAQWRALVAVTAGTGTGLVVLPEMPFSAWLASAPDVDPEAWAQAVDDHERWCARLGELDAEVVVGTRPVVDTSGGSGVRFNEGFVWVAGRGVVGRRRKTFLPDEPGFHEARWYERGPVAFPPSTTPLGEVGLMICTELWFPEHARALGRQGIRLLAVPRATPIGTVEKWEAGARVAAVTSGAFCLSTNRAGGSGDATFGSGSVIVDPEGVVLARTSATTTVATADIDLRLADAAKNTYPRYVDASS